jgi:hypothetical protein
MKLLSEIGRLRRLGLLLLCLILGLSIRLTFLNSEIRRLLECNAIANNILRFSEQELLIEENIVIVLQQYKNLKECNETLD